MIKEDKNRIVATLEEFSNIIPDAFYWLDLNQQYLGVNMHGINATGTQSFEADFLGKTPADLYPEKMAENIINHHKEVTKNKAIIRVEEVIEDVTTKQKRFFHATIAPLLNDSKEVIGTYGISTEITNYKKLEQALISKDNLKKDFIKNFSHDVRLPINGIVGNTQLLQILSKDNNALKQAAINVDNGVISLTKMFEYLESVIKNDELNNEVYNKDFSFKDMIDLEIALTKSSIPPNQNVKVDVSLDDRIPKQLHGDVFKVSQILRNILSNSVRYTKSGEIKLTAEVLEDEADTIKIKFTITDTGTGITTTDKEKIYEYGRRFITSYETNIPGIGIGMYIVKQHVDVLGGTIDYDSTVGEGTRFFVELTFKKVQESSEN